MDLAHLIFSPLSDRHHRFATVGAGHDVAPLMLVPGAEQRNGTWTVPFNLVPTLPGDLRGDLAGDLRTPSGEITLRRYQKEAVQWLEDTPLGGIVALDVGLGKTIVICEFLRRHPELRPFLVIAPLIGMPVWSGPGSDPVKHYGMWVQALRTTHPEDQPIQRTVCTGDGRKVPVDGYYLNYDITDAWSQHVKLQILPKVIIIDECHEIRNVRTREAKTVRSFCRQQSVERRLLLSATPVVNTIMDLYNLLDCAQPYQWGLYCKFNEKITASFGSRYGGEERTEYGFKFTGENNVDELRARLQRALFRRSRFDVRAELPPFERQVLEVPVSALDAKAFAKYRDSASGAEALLAEIPAAQLKRTTAMCSDLSWSKRLVAVKAAADLVRSTGAHKIVIYTWYKRTATYIAKALEDEYSVFGVVTGDTPIEKRLELAREFKALKLEAGEGAIFVATYGSAGEAINDLVAASAGLCVDLYWVPKTLLQAEGRLHREGQRAASVLMQYLVVPNSADTLMWEKLKTKGKAIAATTQDRGGVSLAESLGGRNEAESLKALLEGLVDLGEGGLELT